MPAEIRFPADFLWGAATSAYQIEGSPLADGAGESIWHRFAHQPGRIAGGDTGDVACDHYRRWREDVALMRELGLKAYRFSLSWARLLPAGRGAVNPRGVDFYSRLIDELLAAGIRPFVTLYHWDLPAALDDLGGWVNRDSAEWFADYAELAFRSYGDRVPMWATLNEPYMVSDAGYVTGVHAPGHRSLAEAARVAHHLLLAHGSAVERFRALGRAEIGLVVNLEPRHPASDRPDDVAAARRAHVYINQQYLDPVLLGRYPEELLEEFQGLWPEPSPDDMKQIGQRLDFLGINYYSRNLMRHDPAALPMRASAVRTQGLPRSAMGWEVYPDGLREILCWVKERYGDMPLYVTENGAAFEDPPPTTGTVEDPLRVDYLREHLRAARAAIEQGVDLRGYFAWSLFDNFEWQYGYSKRFGLVHVDFATQERALKGSGLFYREVIRSGGGVLEQGAATTTDIRPHRRAAEG